jgi:hypothetical protein
MERPDLAQEHPPVSFENARYNLQVLAIRCIVDKLTELRAGIDDGCQSNRALFDSFHTLFEAIHKDLVGLQASHVEAREWVGEIREIVTKAVDAFERVANNLPDRERIGETAWKMAANDAYGVLEGEVPCKRRSSAPARSPDRLPR